MNKQHLKALRKQRTSGFGATDEDSVFDWLDGAVTTPHPPHPPKHTSHSPPPNDVWPVRETQPNYIQDYKAFVRGFLFLCNTLQNNNWDSAAANCTKISHSLSVNY